MKIEKLKFPHKFDNDIVHKINEIIDTLTDMNTQGVAPTDSKPECGEKETSPSIELNKLTEAYNKAVANRESNTFKPKEVECPDCQINGMVNCATHGKPYKDCGVKPKPGEIDPIERKICQDNERNHLPCSICGKGMDKPDPRTLDGHCGGCGAEIVKGVMKCDCELPLCPSAGTWGMENMAKDALFEIEKEKYIPKPKDSLEDVIDFALEAPIPDGDITTAEEIARAVRAYFRVKIEMCLRYNASDTHIIAKDLLGEI